MIPSVPRRRRRHGRLESQGSRRRAWFETLEPRVLLDAGGLARAPDFPALHVDLGRPDDSSILLRLDPGATIETVRRVVMEAGLSADAPLQSFSSLVPGLSRISVQPGTANEAALARLRADPTVLYAEPNYTVHIEAIPNDPRFSELWGLNNIGQTGGTDDADIDMPEAWDLAQNLTETIVAVIDTGVDYTHVDLADAMWVNTGETPGDGVDNDGNGYVDDVYGYDFVNRDGDPMDDHDHGTHVAGTIAAVSDNGVGVAGVAPNAKIMALKFLDATGNGTTADAIEAIYYAIANGATISNNSWGFNDGFSQSLYDAIAAARDADHVFVAAAGNGNFLGIGQNNDSIPFYPASYDLDNIVSVAATDHNDNRALFSNYGAASVDLAAPGVGILSTTPGNTYQSFNGTSMASPHVAGVAALLRGLQPGWSYQQTISQLLSAVDPIPAMAGRSVTGGRLNALAAVQGAADPAPEIQVLADGQNILDGQGLVDLGATPPGYPVTQTFTVRNLGTLPLALEEPIAVPAGYTLLSPFDRTTLDTGQTAAFTVQLDATAEGSYAGPISFGNNDEDENPFDFTITGVVAIPPAVQILDNGDQGFETVGAWTRWTGQGFQNDVDESQAGDGTGVASWSFERLLPGTYRVAATWSEYANRATDSPFVILDDSQELATVRVNQQLAPDDFADAGAAWESLGGAFAITSQNLTVRLRNDASGRLNADAIRIERLPDAPEIQVLDGSTDIADNIGVVDFGTTTEGSPVVRTFTVANAGGRPLQLTAPIQTPAGFAVASGFGSTTLQPGESTDFTVRLEADSPGTFGGELSFGDNDADENPFNFTLAGVVDPVAPVQILDDGDAGFSTTGAWTRWTGQGFENDVHESLPGDGTGRARWTFDGLPSGVYRVAATWSEYSNRATNSPFSVLDGSVVLATTAVDQRFAPDDFSDAGASWEQLGSLYTVQSGQLAVELADNADGRLNADAIRIERLPNGPEIEVLLEGTDVQDDTGLADFGETSFGQPLSKTFTVRNRGGAALVLAEPIVVPNGFHVASSFGSTVLAADEATTFVVQLDAGAVGEFVGQLEFGDNDDDENPFNFTVRGVVAAPPAVQILDDGDPGFQTVGSWTRWAGQGYENDIHESLPGGGDVASWTFSNLPSGAYQVAATWSPFSNRATDSPFAISDGQSVLETVRVNQQAAPNDFSDAGASWEELSVVLVQGGQITVQLSDDADGRLNADAIRIERLPPAPEIQVVESGANIPDGGQVDYGQTPPGVVVTRTFTVTNQGELALILDDAIQIPSGYSLASGFGATSLASGETTTFAVRLDAVAEGDASGVISFGTNDGDENPFDIFVTGSVVAPPAVTIVDNGDTGFNTAGSWRLWMGQGFQNDVHEGMAGVGGKTASWTFDSLAPGLYRVSATWSSYSNRAPDAPFTILDGGSPLATVLVDQRLAPNDFSDAGVSWEDLGGSYLIGGSSLMVQLSDDANGRLIADAIRIERLPQTASLEMTPAAPLAGPTPEAPPARFPGGSRRSDDGTFAPGAERAPEAGRVEAFPPLVQRAGQAPRPIRAAVDRVLANWADADSLDEPLLESLARDLTL